MPGKCKGCGDEDNVGVVKEHDPLPEKIAQAYKGMIVCDIHALTNKWSDAVNCDVDYSHVEHL